MFTFANAQVDKEKKSIKIPAEQSQKEKDSSPQKIKVEPKKLPDISKESGGTINGISTKGFNKYKIKESDNNFSMVFDDGLRNPGEIFEKRWKKDAAKTGMIRTMSDQFLGEHRTNTKFVNIVCRDHEYPDGDRVRIFLNDEIVHPEILLTGSYRRVQIDLLEGINKIDIQALNQGESGPNTAEFIVYDDKGSLVSSKEWNLLTGVKATIIFINEKLQIEPKSEGN
ncbi:MAG: hypothetical protein HKN99_01915 [Winogradskyella sp.]|nr:hypothetical protein [Winogradskyella sp.]NNC44619.1 hypothetical protein [Winogradskyella sp.]NNL83174.1 hypothetical protein [Winogradskyella sp.]